MNVDLEYLEYSIVHEIENALKSKIILIDLDWNIEEGFIAKVEINKEEKIFKFRLKENKDVR